MKKIACLALGFILALSSIVSAPVVVNASVKSPQVLVAANQKKTTTTIVKSKKPTKAAKQPVKKTTKSKAVTPSQLADRSKVVVYMDAMEECVKSSNVPPDGRTRYYYYNQDDDLIFEGKNYGKHVPLNQYEKGEPVSVYNTNIAVIRNNSVFLNGKEIKHPNAIIGGLNPRIGMTVVGNAVLYGGSLDLTPTRKDYKDRRGFLYCNGKPTISGSIEDFSVGNFMTIDHDICYLNGRKLGEKTSRCGLDGGNYAFVDISKSDSPAFIYNGKNYGSIDRESYILKNGHFAFHRKVQDKTHVIYDGKDLGEGSLSRIIGAGSHPTDILSYIYSKNEYMPCAEFSAQKITPDRMGYVFLGDKNLGEYPGIGGDIIGVSPYGHVGFYDSSGAFIYDGNVLILSSNKNGISSDSCVSYRTDSFRIDSMSYSMRSPWFGGVPRMEYMESGSHVAYVNQNGHVIYDGKDLGIGSGISIDGDDIAFNTVNASTCEMISNGKKVDQSICGRFFIKNSHTFATIVSPDHKQGFHAVYDGQDIGQFTGEWGMTKNGKLFLYRYTNPDAEVGEEFFYDGKNIGACHRGLNEPDWWDDKNVYIKNCVKEEKDSFGRPLYFYLVNGQKLEVYNSQSENFHAVKSDGKFQALRGVYGFSN